MSDAKVRFETTNYDAAETGREQVFGFNCPRHDRRCEGLVIAGKTDLARDPQGKNGGVAQWGWDGDRESPTFTPSVNCGTCWHGFIERGRCVDTAHLDEPEIARERS